jgi:hypothetical protein
MTLINVLPAITLKMPTKTGKKRASSAKTESKLTKDEASPVKKAKTTSTNANFRMTIEHW